MKGGKTMASVVNNQATIAYNYNTSSASAASNTVATTVLDEYTLTANKYAVNSVYRPGDYTAYASSIVNTGNGSLYSVTVSDDLASGYLTYVDDSLKVFYNGNLVSVTPTTTNPLVFTLPNTMNTNDDYVYVYMATVSDTIPSTVTSITNNQTVTAREGSVTGTLLTVSPTPSATTTLDSYADLSIVKSTDSSSVTSGDALTYQFTITNSGNVEATDVVLTDQLPTGFTITSITSTTDGVTTTYSSSDYTLNATTNTLTLPNSTGTPITVPAATTSGNGTTVINVTGTITV